MTTQFIIVIDGIRTGFFQKKEDAENALKEYVESGFIIEREV